MPDQYAAAIREITQAKIENRAPEVVVAAGKPETAVINIMDALKESMQAKGRAKCEMPCGGGWGNRHWKRKQNRLPPVTARAHAVRCAE